MSAAKKSRRLLNVFRVDHPENHGWIVRFKRHGKIHQAYFRDHGDRRLVLRRALAWRDQMLEKLPPSRRFHFRRCYSNTGVIGVIRWVLYTRKGSPYTIYYAIWYDEHGRPRSRGYSVGKYGEDKARRLAIQARRQALAVLLQPASTT
jgi:hypothetical protein